MMVRLWSRVMGTVVALGAVWAEASRLSKRGAAMAARDFMGEIVAGLSWRAWNTIAEG